MYYIATPIPYVNGDPHLGHLLEAVFNDTLARYKRRTLPDEVKLSMGADQHGLKNMQKAQEFGLTSEEFVKKQAEKFQEVWKEFDIRFDVFIETESREHKVVSQIVWDKLKKKNHIYKKTYQGKYCVGCETFYSDSQLDPEGKCPIHGTEPILMTEENYFFRLSGFVDTIKEYLNTAIIIPQSIKGEWLNFVEQGVEDISISREKKNLPWGIAVPGDSDQVMYVWFEALLNYLTAHVNLQSIDEYEEFPLQRVEFTKQIWSEINDSLPIDFMYLGKDIAKFHLVVWIGMLSALQLPLTKVNLVHGFINDKDGRKMSKSLGNVVTPFELRDKFGIDGTRFLMLHDVNQTGDTPFSMEKSIDSYNANLADNIGNVVVRVSNLIEKFMNGNIDTDLDIQKPQNDHYPILEVDLRPTYNSLEIFNPHLAIQQLIAESTKINQYLEQTKPWMLAKHWDLEGKKVTWILNSCAIALIEIGKALSIFLPVSGDTIYQTFTAQKITKAPILFPKVEVGE